MANQAIFFLDFPLNKLMTDRDKDFSERKLTFKTMPITIPITQTIIKATENAPQVSAELVIRLLFLSVTTLLDYLALPLPLSPTSTPSRRGSAQIATKPWHAIFDQLGQHNLN